MHFLGKFKNYTGSIKNSGYTLGLSGHLRLMSLETILERQSDGPLNRAEHLRTLT